VAEIWNERTMPRPRSAPALVRDVLALEEDLAGASAAEELGQQVEARGLAGAVRADQRVDGAAPHLQ
jgi:hypothetical protein